MLPVELWKWRVDVTLTDLSREERLARVGLSLPRPGRAGWTPFQTIGEELWKAGSAGLIAPSAACPEGLVLCLFRTRHELRGIKAEPPPQTLTAAPVPPTGMAT